MNQYKTLLHRRWNSRYHLMLVPKTRMKVVFIGGSLRRYLSNFVHQPGRQKSIVIVDGNLLHGPADGFPPRMTGSLKSKGALQIARDFKRDRHGSEPAAFRSLNAREAQAAMLHKTRGSVKRNEENYFGRSSWV